jgi:hypothetical protein
MLPVALKCSRSPLSRCPLAGCRRQRAFYDRKAVLKGVGANRTVPGRVEV